MDRILICLNSIARARHRPTFFASGLVSQLIVSQSQRFTFSHIVEQVSEIPYIILLLSGVRLREGEGKGGERAGGVKLKKSRDRCREGGRKRDRDRGREGD